MLRKHEALPIKPNTHFMLSRKSFFLSSSLSLVASFSVLVIRLSKSSITRCLSIGPFLFGSLAVGAANQQMAKEWHTDFLRILADSEGL